MLDKFARQGLYYMDFPYDLDKATYVWADKSGKAYMACYVIGKQSTFTKCNSEDIPKHLCHK